jgi:lipoate-protein ligase B
VGYPILHLRQRGLGVRRYVAALEEVLLRTCAEFGVIAQRQTGRPGLFAEGGKIAAVGVAVQRGVSFHGFALNVSPDLSHYRWIVPCGLANTPATSLDAERGEAPDPDEVAEVLVEKFRAMFGVSSTP